MDQNPAWEHTDKIAPGQIQRNSGEVRSDTTVIEFQSSG